MTTPRANVGQQKLKGELVTGQHCPMASYFGR
jgi:hypothetical protein